MQGLGRTAQEGFKVLQRAAFRKGLCHERARPGAADQRVGSKVVGEVVHNAEANLVDTGVSPGVQGVFGGKQGREGVFAALDVRYDVIRVGSVALLPEHGASVGGSPGTHYGSGAGQYIYAEYQRRYDQQEAFHLRILYP